METSHGRAATDVGSIGSSDSATPPASVYAE